MEYSRNLQIIANRTRWRYLDSLDSIRFTDDYVGISQNTQQRLVQAQIDLYLAFLMGSGITIPNNQLVDSFGYLYLASKIISAANKETDAVFVPLQFSGYDYNGKVQRINNDSLDVFDLAGHLFGLGHRGFELSAWRKLTQDDARRERWASVLKNKEGMIDKKHIKDDEESLVKDMFNILNFFYRHPERQIRAGGIQKTRIDTVNSIANLSENDKGKYKIFRDLDDQQYQLCLDIGHVFDNLREMGIPIDNRSKIKQALIDRKEECLDGLDKSLWREIIIGVMKAADGLYNFSQYVASRAKQDSFSDAMSSSLFLLYKDVENIRENAWAYDEAAYLVANWARENYRFENRVNYQEDIASHQKMKLNLDIPVEQFSLPGDKDVWLCFFEFQQSPKWQASILNYMDALDVFENSYIKYWKSFRIGEQTDREKYILVDMAKRYEEARKKHVRLVIPEVLSRFYKVETNRDDEDIIKLYNKKGEFLVECHIEDFAKDPLLDKFEATAKYTQISAGDNEIKIHNAERGDEKQGE